MTMNYLTIQSKELPLNLWQEASHCSLPQIYISFGVLSELFDLISIQQSEIYRLKNRCQDLASENQELKFNQNPWSREGEANCNWRDDID
jgi:hypothetical protein